MIDNGNIEENYRYTAFVEVEIYSPVGVRSLADSAIGNTVLWNIRRYDADTNLYYYNIACSPIQPRGVKFSTPKIKVQNARRQSRCHYKADYGRWLGRDPIEEDSGQENLYGFVHNNPIYFWDWLGLRRPPDRKPGDLYSGSITSTCPCPIKVTVTKSEWFFPRYGTKLRKAGVGMRFSFTYKPEFDPTKEPCCIKNIRIIQIVGKFGGGFKEPNEPSKTTTERGERTTDDGWRVDWPQGLDPAVPYWDNSDFNPPLGIPWERGRKKPGYYLDPPEIHKHIQRFEAYACFIGEHAVTGKKMLLGCLKWGFKVSSTSTYKKNSNEFINKPVYDVLPGTLSFDCKLPPGGQGAFDKWNDAYPGDENNVPKL